MTGEILAEIVTFLSNSHSTPKLPFRPNVMPIGIIRSLVQPKFSPGPAYNLISLPFLESNLEKYMFHVNEAVRPGIMPLPKNSSPHSAFSERSMKLSLSMYYSYDNLTPLTENAAPMLLGRARHSPIIISDNAVISSGFRLFVSIRFRLYLAKIRKISESEGIFLNFVGLY